jgi:hypothetical protein
MADSLRYDRDLQYEPRDFTRAERLRFGGLPRGLFLLKGPRGYSYAKPFLYAVVNAPFYAVLGVRGFTALNGLLLATLVLLGADILTHKVEWRVATFGAAVVVLFSVTPAYLHWVDPFLFSSCLVAGAVAAYRRQRAALVAVLIVMAGYVRFPYLLLALAPALLYCLDRRWRDLTRFVIAAAAAGLVLLVIGHLIYGQWSPYTGERFYYPDLVPYQAASDGEIGVPWSRTAALEGWHWPTVRELAQSNFYFFFGRFAGVFVYYPTLLVCILWMQRCDREKVAWLGALGAACLTLQILLPHNPFGGSGALGSRLFVLLPVALVAVDCIEWNPLRLLATAPLLLIAVPVLRAPVYFSASPGLQMLEFPYRYLPLEWTQASMIRFPFSFPAMHALSANQYDYEPSGGVWTIGGTKAEFVFIRPAGSPVTLRLTSLLPAARVTDGEAAIEMRFSAGVENELTLAHPMATFRDENQGFREFSVFYLTVETQSGVRPSAVEGGDARYLGVFVRPS